MIQGKWLSPGENLEAEALPLRLAVFGRGADDLDPLSWNALIYDDGKPVASGRIWWQDGAYWLDEIGVLPDHRGRRLGDLALRLLLFKAQSHAAREVRLRCPQGTEGFFSRLGFQPVARTDTEVEMLLPGDQIDLDTCKNCKKQNCPNRK